MRYTYHTTAVARKAMALKRKNPQEYDRIKEIAIDAAKDPSYFVGCGREPKNGRSGLHQPERLKESLTGWYSCELSKPDRLVYRQKGGIFVILSFEGHYSNLSSDLGDLSFIDEAFGVEAY
jgi:Txe/YoeB family toxin of Txe-Axe toxin-antitoxin module